MSEAPTNTLSDYELTPLGRALDRPVAFHRAFLSFGAGITGALMLSQAMYWSTRTNDPEKWFYKSREEWEEETGLSRYEQEGARKNLVKFGVLEEQKKGVPCKLYYRVNFRVLSATLLGEIPQTSRRKNHKLAGVKPANRRGEKPPAITESTQETTPETTPVAGEAGASTGGEMVPAKKPAAKAPPKPTFIEVGGNQIEVPGELRYPGPGTKSYKTWMNYAVCYQRKYGAWPVWNQSIAGKLSQFIARIGEEVAPKVAAFYVMRVVDAHVAKDNHPIGLLLMKAETYHTQYLTGRTMTNTEAAQLDKTQTNMNVAEGAQALMKQRREARRGSTTN